MGSVFGIVWKTAAWVALAWGFLATEKVRVAMDDRPELRRVDVPLHAGVNEMTYEATRDGDLPLEVSIVLHADSDIEVKRAAEWNERGATAAVAVRWKKRSGTLVHDWTLDRDRLKIMRGGTASRMLVGRSELKVEADTEYIVRVESVGDDAFFFAREPLLSIGGLKAVELPKTARRMIEGRRVWPGLLLLSGVFGVFVHLFFVLAHLLVPWNAAAPEFIADEPEL